MLLVSFTHIRTQEETLLFPLPFARFVPLRASYITALLPWRLKRLPDAKGPCSAG